MDKVTPKSELFQANKERLNFEIEEWKERAEHMPTDLTVKYELGRRLWDAKQYDDAIVALQKEGTVRKGDPLQLARFIWAAVHGLSMLIIDGQLPHEQAQIDDLIQFTVERINTGIARPARQNDR